MKLLRAIPALLLLAGVAVLATPFLLASLYIDQRGVTLQGRVYSKDEMVDLRYGHWSRICRVTVEYQPPDSSPARQFVTDMQPDEYDGLFKGQSVPIHYLRLAQLPQFPMVATLAEMHFLPQARMANRTTFTTLERAWHSRFVQWALAVAILLTVWRIAKWPRFAWAVAASVAAAFGAMWIDEFPRPTPAPVHDVRQAMGHVTTVQTIRRILDGHRSRGIELDQTVDVVGVEFVPAGRTEPVLGIDLMDSGSNPPHQQGAPVTVDYEAAAPRTAWVRGASRSFAERNFTGIVIGGAIAVAFLALWIGMIEWFSRAGRRALQRRMGG